MKRYQILSSFFVIAAALVLSSFMPMPGGYQVGASVTDFHLKNVDGKVVSLSQYKNVKGFIVVFTCNHCPFAKMYESRIMDLNAKYAPKGFPVIAISGNDATMVPEDSYPNMVSLANAKHYTFPYLYDETQKVTREFGATNTPHVFVISKENGKYVVQYIGAIDNNAQEADKATKFYVADAVDALLAGQPVPITQTKAIGCGIKLRNS